MLMVVTMMTMRNFQATFGYFEPHAWPLQTRDSHLVPPRNKQKSDKSGGAAMAPEIQNLDATSSSEIAPGT